jgi:anti-sigma factor RsiW
MNCEDFRAMITAWVDGELPGERQGLLQEHLAGCEGCRRELAEVRALKEELSMIRFSEPTDAELARYWKSVYNRLERGLAWILLSIGTIVLLCYGGFRLVEHLIRDPQIAWWVKGGVLAVVFGLAILVVSLLRERLAVRRSDKYSREVDR